MNKVVIIDDEPLARSIVLEYLKDQDDLEVVAECNNGFEGVKAIQQHQPSLVFLDVQMPKINGFEMLELLEEIPPVIFATAFDEYAISAFEKNAVDYLLKPFSKQRFEESLAKWRNRNSVSAPKVAQLLNQNGRPEDRNRIVVRNNGEISIIPVSNVHYIEAFDDYVKIFTDKSYFLKKKTMNFYEEFLDPSQFFRAHRSFIINLKELMRIEPLEKNAYVVLLRSGKRIPLSRGAYSKLREQLGI